MADKNTNNQKKLHYTCSGCGENLSAPLIEALQIRECSECGTPNEVPFMPVPISTGGMAKLPQGEMVSVSASVDEENFEAKESIKIQVPNKVNNEKAASKEYREVTKKHESLGNPKTDVGGSTTPDYKEPATSTIAPAKNMEGNEPEIIALKEEYSELASDDKRAIGSSRKYLYLVIFLLFFGLGFLGVKYQDAIPNEKLQSLVSNLIEKLPSSTAKINSAPPLSALQATAPQSIASPQVVDITDEEKRLLEAEVSSIWLDFNKSAESAKAYKANKLPSQVIDRGSFDQIIKNSLLGNESATSPEEKPKPDNKLSAYNSEIANRMASAGSSYKKIYDVYKNNPERVTDFLNSLDKSDDFSDLLGKLPEMLQTYKSDDQVIKKYLKSRFFKG